MKKSSKRLIVAALMACLWMLSPISARAQAPWQTDSTTNPTWIASPSTANVGIGTATPQSRCDVSGYLSFGTNQISGFRKSAGKGILIDAYGPSDIEFLASTASNGYGARMYAYNGDGSFRIATRANAASWTDSMTFLGSSVGLGTITPQTRLDVTGGYLSFGTSQAGGFRKTAGSGILIDPYGPSDIEFLASSASNGYGARLYASNGDGSFRIATRSNSTTWTDVMSFLGGNVGIGVTSPTTALQIATPGAALFPARFLSTTSGSGVMLDMTGNGEIDVAGLKIGGTALPDVQSPGQSLYLNRSTNYDVIVGSSTNTHGLQVQSTGTSSFAGNVSVAGTLTATSVVNAVYGQDVAEWVRGDRELAPGTVVIVNPEKTNEVMPSSKAYDTSVAGVVSSQPGVILGRPGELKATIATSGRVRVKVDARRGAIRMGDLLVTSDEPGTAMKSEPIEVGGRKFHQPGTIVGKALEPLPDGVGEILVLLCLG
ncbi:MAG TPA: hypothetical protein VJZ76_07125 [Thermoanaerobaculia bacterium]|nr:hypothetical protein [Thermoanaerobaculia bacterium]